jgi:hypothetical protein
MGRAFGVFILLGIAAVGVADTVHLNDGSTVEGRITMCDEAECVVARKKIPRADIARIVFEAAELPFAVRGILFKDGRFRGGTFSGLNLGYVELNGDEEFDRDEVAAIIITPIPRPPEPPAPQPPIVQPGNPPPPAPSPVAPPAQPTPAPPPPTSSPGPTGGAGPAPCDPINGVGNGSRTAWIGKGRQRSTMGNARWRHERTAEFEAQLRELCHWDVLDLTVSPTRKVGTVLVLSGSVTEHETFIDHNTDLVPCLCDGEKTHTSSFDSAMIFQRTADGDTTRSLGFQLPTHRRPIYTMSLGGQGTIEAPCRGESCGGSGGGTMLQLNAGRVRFDVDGWDPEERTVQGGILRGTYTRPVGPSTLQTSWSICRAGVQCPPPPEFEPPPPGETPPEPPPDDPCGRSGQQQALADTCRAQLDSMVAALEPLFADYNRLMSAVESDRAAFEAMQNYCLAYDVVQTILESILTGGTGAAAEAAQALLHLRDLIGKIQSGSIVEEFYPSEVKKVLDMYRKTQEIWFELTADDVTRMQRDVSDCSGKAPIDTYMAAKRFVDNLAASRQLWDSRLAPAINDVRGRGQECANRNHAAWRACLEAAQCRDEAPDCGTEPPLDGAYDQ